MKLYREACSTYGYAQLNIHLAALNALQKEISTQLTNKKPESDAADSEVQPGADNILTFLFSRVCESL